MKKVRKAIIPSAGLDTRFLPATKAMPKDMLPIIDKPTIQYLVEEAVQSGIEDIIIVTDKGKCAIEDRFDMADELEQTLLQKEKYELLQAVRRSSAVDIHYIRQKEAKGLGHSVWCARNFIGDEPFAVLLGDDIVQAEVPCTRQLIEQFERTGHSVVGVQQSSNLAIMDRYILTPDIFDILELQEPGDGGEIQLTDAIRKLNDMKGVYAYNFEGTQYGVGEKLGFILTTLDFALRSGELRMPLVKALEDCAL